MWCAALKDLVGRAQPRAQRAFHTGREHQIGVLAGEVNSTDVVRQQRDQALVIRPGSRDDATAEGFGSPTI